MWRIDSIIKKLCVSCWTPHILQDDTRFVQYQIIIIIIIIIIITYFVRWLHGPFLNHNGSNFSILFWKPSAFMCWIEISDILIYFILTLSVATLFPLEALQRLMPSMRLVTADLLDVYIMTNHVRTFNRLYTVLRPLGFNMNRGFNSATIFVINLIIFFYLLSVFYPLSSNCAESVCLYVVAFNWSLSNCPCAVKPVCK